MSHISKIDTKIKNLQMLKKALEALEMKYVEAEEGQKLTLQGYGKDEQIEDCIFEIKTGSKYSIGIRKVENDYEVVADWWAIETFTGQKQDEIMNKITRQYAYETIIDKVKDMGYSVVQEDEDTKNNIHLTVRRWS
ncbi:MAG: DUF1257 domain-containing protein [Treponema sp.]|nr:DUF1257 domain-containing protein [Treponema sp.]